jgi:hypothetical protein
MARFNQIAIGQIFFEGETGEYYVKKSEKSSWVYDIAKDHAVVDRDGQPMQCQFPAEHQVEDF